MNEELHLVQGLKPLPAIARPSGEINRQSAASGGRTNVAKGFNPWRRSRFAVMIAASLVASARLTAGEPVLRLESHAPLSLVTSTTFGPDGRLYVAGFDKVVRSWKHDDDKGWRPAISYRVPIGPGIAGALNDVAISDDNRWLATGGNGWFRKMSDFRDNGVLLGRNAMDADSRREVGAVYLFDREVNASAPLKHHEGPVVALSFDGQTLASLAWEFTDKQDVGEYTVALWDVPSKRLLAQTKLTGVPSPLSIRPGFIVRRLSQVENDVAVVAAFGKETVHIWRPTRAADWIAVPVGAVATCTCAGAGPTAYVGCMMLVQKKWTPTVASLSLAAESPRIADVDLLASAPPGAIVGISASRDPGTPIVGLIYRTLQGDKQDFLYVHKSEPAGKKESRHSLGRAITQNPPRISISSTGKYAAVADPGGGRFRVLAIFDDRDQGAVFGAQNGLTFPAAHAAFAEKDGDLGFAFPPKGEVRDLGPTYLDLKSGEFQHFEIAFPNTMVPWKFVSQTLPPGVAIRPILNGSALQCVTASGDRFVPMSDARITAALGLQPRPNEPILAAVALVDRLGQPELRIYNAETGEQLRRCTGHAGRITGLSSSGDGGLLLSSSEDQTLGLWNVADLFDPTGVVGAVQAIKLDDARRIVASDVPALQVGDVIVGRNANDKFQAFNSQVDFHGAAKSTRPGQMLALVAERDGQRFNVALPVVRGMDERKPLAQLYCREDGKWIAWSPFGPYDSNTDAAEEWIGWHFNPEGDAPVRFALGNQYRQQYRRPGLLRRLLQTRNLTAALDAWRRLDAEPPDPNISLAVSPLDLNRGDAWVATKPDVDVTLRITNADFPLERLAALKAAVDGEPVTLERVKPTEYRGRVSLKKPGRHALRMTADTTAPLARHFDDERELVFAPPKPTLTPSDAWVDRSKAKPQADGVWTAPNQEAADFRLQARLAADPAFGAMTSRITLNGEPVASAANLDDLRLPLRIGENRIVVSAAPRSPNEGVEECAQFVVVVRRTEPPETFAPPTIAVERVEFGKDRTPVSLSAGGSATVPSTLVRLVGRATSKENVAKLDIEDLAAPGFVANKNVPFEFETTLKPGSNRIRLLAKGASGVESRQELTFDCKPPLAKPVLALENEGRDVQWTGAPLSAKISVAFDGRGERLPFTVTLKRNGEVVAKSERMGDLADRWTVDVPIVPGENRFTVESESSWAKATGSTATIWVRRPPKLLGVSSSAVGAKPFVDLTADVDALDGWPATELVVNGRVHQDVERRQVGQANASRVVRWRLVARNVSLQQGKNDFSVSVRNAEGESTTAAVSGVVFAPPPPPKAVVTWLSPAEDGNRDRPELDLRLRIESTTPLTAASLAITGADARPLSDLKPTSAAAGRYVYEIQRPATLEPGRRALAVRVVNDGGETLTERVVNYVPRPARVNLLALEGGGARVEAKRAADGGAVFGAVNVVKQTLLGEVVFADANAPDLAAPVTLRVLVNGMQQRTVELGPAEGNVRRFRATISLNRNDANHLFAEAVGLSVDADASAQGIVGGCAAPIARQRLHFVLIGVGDKDEAKLREEALAAFEAAVEGDGSPSSGRRPAFERPRIRHAVCGYVTAPTIREAVDKLRMELVETSARQEGNDVVVFYFRGQALGEQRRLKLLTSEPDWLPRSKFDAGDLTTRFADVPGAQLLLLDVASANADEFRSLDKPFSRRNACLLGFRRPPKEAPILFSAVRAAMPKVSKLGELQQALKTGMPKGAAYDPYNYVPEPLEELALSRAEGG